MTAYWLLDLDVDPHDPQALALAADVWCARGPELVDAVGVEALEGLLGRAEALSGGASGVYFTLNPLSLLPGVDRAAKVGDVVRRRWLPVDN